MPKVAFTILEFFGLLGTGYLWFRFVGHVFAVPFASEPSPGPGDAALIILISYTAGSVVSNIAEYVLEQLLVPALLGRPEEILLSRSCSPRLVRYIFPGYMTPLPSEVAQRACEAMEARAVPTDPQARFHHARQIAKEHEQTWMKVEAFLGLFVFSRNISFSLFLMGLVSAVTSLIGGDTLTLPAACFAGSIGMFYRFLKFYRQYSFELFSSYPDIARSGDAA